MLGTESSGMIAAWHRGSTSVCQITALCDLLELAKSTVQELVRHSTQRSRARTRCCKVDKVEDRAVSEPSEPEQDDGTEAVEISAAAQPCKRACTHKTRVIDGYHDRW